MAESDDHTFSTRFRIPRVMWDAYGRVATGLHSDRTALLLDHVRADIRAHGTAEDIAALEEGSGNSPSVGPGRVAGLDW